MTIKEIDKTLLSMERKSRNGITLLNTRRGAAGDPEPFIAFLDDGNIETIGKEPILYKAANIYNMIDFIREYLRKNPETGYFYA